MIIRAVGFTVKIVVRGFVTFIFMRRNKNKAVTLRSIVFKYPGFTARCWLSVGWGISGTSIRFMGFNSLYGYGQMAPGTCRSSWVTEPPTSTATIAGRKKSLIITVDQLRNCFTRQTKVDSYVRNTSVLILLNHHKEYNINRCRNWAISINRTDQH